MKLILRTSVTHLGEPGDFVEVKRGYARNYLLPKGLAIEATESNIRSIGTELDRLQDAAAAKREHARQIAAKLATLVLTMERKVADPETGSLYGSVSTGDIGDVLDSEGYEINRGEIHLDHPIKSLGDYEVSVSLAHGVKGMVNVTVVADRSEDQPAVEQTPVEAASDDVDAEESADDTDIVEDD